MAKTTVINFSSGRVFDQLLWLKSRIFIALPSRLRGHANICQLNSSTPLQQLGRSATILIKGGASLANRLPETAQSPWPQYILPYSLVSLSYSLFFPLSVSPSLCCFLLLPITPNAIAPPAPSSWIPDQQVCLTGFPSSPSFGHGRRETLLPTLQNPPPLALTCCIIYLNPITSPRGAESVGGEGGGGRRGFRLANALPLSSN